MEIFEKAGKAGSERAIELALKKAGELGCGVVASYSRGYTASLLAQKAKEMGFQGPLIVVRSVSSAAQQGVNAFPTELKEKLQREGVQFVTAAHALSAGERGISTRLKGAYPLEIMAHTLRTFGAGTKVCFECAVMAMDADLLPYGKPVVALGGTGQGVDTAMVITPSYSASILDTRIHEILCKPGFYKEEAE